MPLPISAVPSEEVDYVWSQVEPMVERGLRHAGDNSTTPDLIREDIRRGQLLLWVVHEGQEVVAAVVLNVVKRLRGIVLVVVMAAGRDFHQWAATVIGLIRDYAQLIGAVAVEATVRRGMEKWLSELGWRRQAVIMELGDG